ncbi:hypothetical protein [Sphingomonas sp. R86520]|uniref:hypothetical protein n=1 Tax=Sphingomonas sp. R86520 TaxID=3093859 RepID=UPI0036D3E42D
MAFAAAMSETKAPSQRSTPTGTLDALNFFLADVRDGLGPYLAIYLLVVRGPSHGWNEATVGLVLTIAGIVGLLSQTPAGGLIDRARLSATLAGSMIVWAGYSASFLTLAGIAVAGFVLYLTAMPETHA